MPSVADARQQTAALEGLVRLATEQRDIAAEIRDVAKEIRDSRLSIEQAASPVDLDPLIAALGDLDLPQPERFPVGPLLGLFAICQIEFIALFVLLLARL